MGEPKEVEINASTQGPRVRHKGDKDEAGGRRDTTTGKGCDTLAWDTTDDARGRGVDWPGRGIAAVGSEDTVEGQRS